MGSQEFLLRLAGAGLWKERVEKINTWTFIQVRAVEMRNTLLLLAGVYLVFLD